MTRVEIIEMAIQAGAKQMLSSLTYPNGPVTALKFDFEQLEDFAKLLMERQSKNIKHSLAASSVSIQSRVYIGEEVVSKLRMTHEEIRARGDKA